MAKRTTKPISRSIDDRSPAPDQAERDLITRELDKNMLVEAAAGTGKTTSLVARMVNLLREGRCRVDQIAAVTFTRKSAAELRSRFQLGIEKAARARKETKRHGSPRPSHTLSDALSEPSTRFAATCCVSVPSRLASIPNFTSSTLKKTTSCAGMPGRSTWPTCSPLVTRSSRSWKTWASTFRS